LPTVKVSSDYCRRQRFQKTCEKFILKSFLQLLPTAKVSSNYCRRQRFQERCEKFILKSFLQLLPTAKVSSNYCRRQRFQAINADDKGFKKWRRKFICFITLSNDKREKEALYIPHRFLNQILKISLDFKNLFICNTGATPIFKIQRSGSSKHRVYKATVREAVNCARGAAVKMHARARKVVGTSPQLAQGFLPSAKAF
jgi:hypothetical protein